VFGVVVITHENLGEKLLSTAETIVGKLENVVPVSLGFPPKPESTKKEIEEAIKKVNKGKGVILLTDLFGGTPSNIAISFLNQDNIEVVSGANLPMAIKIPFLKNLDNVHEAAKMLKQCGHESISVASHLLSDNDKTS
jgi:PTS system mannose-specific IIA component